MFPTGYSAAVEAPRASAKDSIRLATSAAVQPVDQSFMSFYRAFLCTDFSPLGGGACGLHPLRRGTDS